LVVTEASKRNIDTLAYQQIQRNQTDISLQIRELKKSKARIFINWIYSLDFPVVLEEANKQDIIGPTYVWFCSDACAQNNVFTNSKKKNILKKEGELD
jgi:hypothetical protein